MGFLDGGMIWHAAWILPMLAVMAALAASRRRRVLRALLGGRAGEPAHVTLSRGARGFKLFLFACVSLALLLAAARPYWGRRTLPWSAQGRDIMFVLDASRSMLATDVSPSRLEHAKWLVRRLVSATPADRHGVIAFAGLPFLECPLTVDKTSLLRILDEVSPTRMPMGGTNIGSALELALGAFRAAETNNRAVVLITDGDEILGDSPRIIEEYRQAEVPLLVVGLGDPVSPGVIMVPREDGGGTSILRDGHGEVVVSRLNEELLKTLALGTGGLYLRSTATNPGLETLESRVRRLATGEFEALDRALPIERFPLPLAIAMLLLWLWLLIPERRKAMVAAVFAAAATLCLPIPGYASAPDAPQSGLDIIDDPVVLYNTALSIHHDNQELARELYERAINLAAKTPEARARAFQNLGVMTHQTAREAITKAGAAATGDLDAAAKLLKESMGVMDEGEYLYRRSLSESPPEPGGLAANQQKLLADRDRAERMLLTIEELKKQIQEAMSQAEQAKQQPDGDEDNRQEQREGQQDGEPKKDGGEPDSQPRQDGGQDDTSQDGGEPDSQPRQDGGQDDSARQRQQAESTPADAAEAAKSAAGRARESAAKLGNEDIERSAAAAADELSKAIEARGRGEEDESHKHLDEALRHLRAAMSEQHSGDEGDEPPEKGDNGGDDNTSEKPENSEGDEGDGKNGGDEDRELPKPTEQRSGQELEGQKTDIDPRQAEALLDLMAEEERGLRDTMRENLRRQHHLREVEKDW